MNVTVGKAQGTSLLQGVPIPPNIFQLLLLLLFYKVIDRFHSILNTVTDIFLDSYSIQTFISYILQHIFYYYMNGTL